MTTLFKMSQKLGDLNVKPIFIEVVLYCYYLVNLFQLSSSFNFCYTWWFKYALVNTLKRRSISN